MGGIVQSTGWDGEPPFKLLGPMAAFVAGLHAATAMFAAVYGVGADRERAAHIDISEQETFLQHWSRHIGQWSYSGAEQRRDRRSLDAQGVPSMARASDGWICLAVRDARWNTVASLLGLDQFTATSGKQRVPAPNAGLRSHPTSSRPWRRARATSGSAPLLNAASYSDPFRMCWKCCTAPNMPSGSILSTSTSTVRPSARRDCHSPGRCNEPAWPSKTILFDVQDGIARVTLNRPERLNAMTWQMIEEFLEAAEICRRDAGVRGWSSPAPGAPSPRATISSVAWATAASGGNPGGINNDRGLHHALVKSLLELPKPVVAALNGRCHGAGFVLSLACDFRVGHTETLVGDIRSGRAIFAGQGVPLLLPRLIGQSRALDLLMTGRVIDGAEAERIGLLSRLVAAFDLRGGPRRVFDPASPVVRR